MTETVRIENGAIQCICGNSPETGGFYACDSRGTLVEPTAAEWPDPLYLCTDCGRIIRYPNAGYETSADVVGNWDVPLPGF